MFRAVIADRGQGVLATLKQVLPELQNHHLYLLFEDLDTFNQKLADYLTWYNSRRPHKSLGMQAPIPYLLNHLTSQECKTGWTHTRTCHDSVLGFGCNFMSKSIPIICIDFQKDFTAPGGTCYKPRPSVDFLKEKAFPFLSKYDLKIHEIISDYRQPRPGDSGSCCIPGEAGFESEVPTGITADPVWIKCMNSPIWIRENIGIRHKEPGLPYQDPMAFSKWLERFIPERGGVEFVVLIGLTVDCCVLSVAQELCWRGMNVRILYEGTDVYSGNEQEKEYLFSHPPLLNWAEPVLWEVLQTQLRTL